MTTQFTPNYTLPSAPKKPRRWVKPALFAAAAVLVFGAGAATGTTETVTVEKEVQVPGPERVVEVEKEVEVEVTPQSCLTALTLSEEAFDIASEAMGHVAAQNVAGIDQGTADLQALAPDLLAAKAACRSN